MTEIKQCLHANCLRLGTIGILVQGGSGAGKSTITRALLERATWFGRDAKLIADDYTHIFIQNHQLIGQVPDNLRGAVEIRGAGIYKIDYEEQVHIQRVVKLGEDSTRAAHDQYFEFSTIRVPLLCLPSLDETDVVAICQAIEASCFGTLWNKTLLNNLE